MIKDLHILPQLRDSISYIYIEHAVIVQKDSSIVAVKQMGHIPIPVASLTCLMLGPGVNITHSAIKVAAESGCMIIWCGDHGSFFYASGAGETRSAHNVMIQAKYCMDKTLHMEVVRKMYEIRFPKMDCSKMTLQQIRGLEGIRVRQAYQSAARLYGIKWKSRKYKKDDWDSADEINRALSSANALLYSICQATIVSLGYSTALGFVHTGKMLSFVYDIADLYKAETTIPAAFEAVKANRSYPEKEVRNICRKYFQKIKLMQRIAKDIASFFADNDNEQADALRTGELWNKEDISLPGGKNYADEVISDGSDSD